MQKNKGQTRMVPVTQLDDGAIDPKGKLVGKATSECIED